MAGDLTGAGCRGRVCVCVTQVKQLCACNKNYVHTERVRGIHSCTGMSCVQVVHVPPVVHVQVGDKLTREFFNKR